ncbi:MAG: hypothetical protein ACRBFS_15860 [Aureispira sp.]
MRWTTVLVTGISILLMLFTACEKTETYYCEEGVEGTYERTNSTTSKTSLEITTGTLKNEVILLLRTVDKTKGINTSVALTAYLEDKQLLIIPQQDYGSIEVQVFGQLQLDKTELLGTLYINEPQATPILIQHQKQ